MAAERQAQQRGLSAVLGKHAQPIKHSMRLPLVQGSGEHAVADLFAYVSPANETRFLQNAELRGVTVLLVGSTGSGKSSLANLMYTVVRRAAGGRAAPLPFEVFDDGQEGTMCVRCAEASVR